MEKEFIKWNPKLSVKVKKIDEQHKKLVNIINKVHSMEQSNKNKEELVVVLNELVEFSRVHFETEEKYFRKFKYEGATEHIREHEDLIRKALEFYKRFSKQGVKILPQFLVFLKAWLEDHLIKMDQKYVKCFQDCGLK